MIQELEGLVLEWWYTTIVCYSRIKFWSGKMKNPLRLLQPTENSAPL